MATSEMKTESEKEPLPCPRCDSTNTKFCYYNNYNFSQPRHFCKACRRYWTQGGTLRDVPVGGASRRTAKRLRTGTISSGPVFVSAGGGMSGNIVGGFSSMLNGFEDAGFGLARGFWAFPESGFLNGGDTWQGNCFASFPDLAFSSAQGNSTLK